MNPGFSLTDILSFRQFLRIYFFTYQHSNNRMEIRLPTFFFSFTSLILIFKPRRQNQQNYFFHHHPFTQNANHQMVKTAKHGNSENSLEV